MIDRILNSKTNNFTAAAFLIAISTFLSASLGLLRDRLLAGTFGAGETLDVYFAAFRIPDLLHGILVAGGISAAFLPIFSKEFEKERKRAFLFANNILNFSLISLFIISILLCIFTPQILKLIAPGFSKEQIRESIFLTRIFFLSPIFFSISSILSGVLQYFDKFLVYSLAPILYNLGIISGILFFVPRFGIYGLGYGVILGAALHVLIQIPAAKSSGFYYSRILDLKDTSFSSALKLMIPSAIGSGFSQLNLIIITALSSLLIPGTISIFTFSKNLEYFPISMIGVPFAISSFPILSKLWAINDKEKFWNCFSSVLRKILFLIIPVSALIFILRAQIVRIVLGTGEWGWLETRLTAACLGTFSFSMFALSALPFFQRSFYAICDTKTPTFLQIFNVLLNIVFSLVFLILFGSENIISRLVRDFLKLENIENIKVLAFPLSLGISGIVQTFILFSIFVRKVGFSKFGEIIDSFKKILILTFITGQAVWLFLRPLAGAFDLDTFFGVLFQAGFAFFFGILFYLGGAFVLKMPELQSLFDSVLKKRKDNF